MLVYGLSVYNEKKEFSGMNVFYIFKTLDEICEYIDGYIEDTISDTYVEEKRSIEEINTVFKRVDHAIYKILDFQDGERFVYEIVSLVLK